jgi:hypothetical protein
MLETGGVLRTWALAAEPCMGREIGAEALPDHRLAYLDYEGEVSGGRGRVFRVDQGEYETQHEAPGVLTVRLIGVRYVGHLELRKVSGDNPTQSWVVRFTFCPPAA